MAYDVELADRIRDLMVGVPVVEKKMFGGLAFLVGGHMSVTASRDGGLMIRCEPSETQAFLAEPGAEMVMRGKAMSGWLRVQGDVLADDDALQTWVERGVAYAVSLEPK